MSEGIDVYTAPPRLTKEFVLDCLEADLVPFIQSSPGIGKSDITRKISKDHGLQLIDHRLSTSAPEDLSGLPRFTEDGKATFAPFDIFPTEDTPLPPGKDGWLLFLDEFNSAAKSVQAAAYKLILDKQVGQHRLHPRVKIVAAGNKATDRAIVNPLSTAMQSRVIHINMVHNVEEWIEDAALPLGFDNRIIAYISYAPADLMDFRPDHNDKTFSCPRTWEFMSKLIKGKEVTDRKAGLYAGTITSGTAVKFIQFTKVFQNLPNIGIIIGNPDGTPVPNSRDIQFATILHLMEKVEDNNLADVAKYVNRFGSEFRILFYRGLLIRKPQLKMHPAFRGAMVDLSRYLHD